MNAFTDAVYAIIANEQMRKWQKYMAAKGLRAFSMEYRNESPFGHRHGSTIFTFSFWVAVQRRLLCHACSRTTSSAFLSVRSPRNTGCRISPSLVHSVNFTWPTSLGISQVVAFSFFTF